MTEQRPTVFVVEDDFPFRRSLEGLLAAAGLRAETYASSREFLAAFDPERPGCLILDLRLRGEDGLDLLDHLRQQARRPPTIVLTAFGSVPRSVRALRAGAIDFLEKPARPRALLACIREALETDRRQRVLSEEHRAVEERSRRLSAREQEVATFLAAGKRSREIATELGISVRTVEGYRSRLLQKMRVASTNELIAILIRHGVAIRT
jgi:FixJ family two-component response regulator